LELGQDVNANHTLEDLYGSEKQIKLIRA